MTTAHHQIFIGCGGKGIIAMLPALLHPLYWHDLHAQSNCHLQYSHMWNQIIHQHIYHMDLLHIHNGEKYVSTDKT